MSIKINKYFHPRSVELVKAFDEGRAKLELDSYPFGTLILYYEIALANDFSTACRKIEHELEVQDKTEWIVPRALFTQFNSSMLSEQFAQLVAKSTLRNCTDLAKACYQHFPPSFGYMTSYLMAVAFNNSDIAELLKNIIKRYESVAVCMPRFLELAQTPDISERLAELSAKYGNTNITEQVEVEEDIEKHTSLNPQLFTGQKLKPEVRDKAIEVSNELLAMLKENGIELKLKDLILTGSNASYNYTKDSDLDIHLVADMSGINDPEGLYPVIFTAFKSAFNRKFDIDFYGIPVEVYIESSDTPLVSNGIYSVFNDSWVKEPVNEEIPEINIEDLEKDLAPWETRYQQIIDTTDAETAEDTKAIDSFIDELYQIRAKGLANGGEYSTENLIFKEIRNKGYLDKLKELRDLVIANRLSID